MADEKTTKLSIVIRTVDAATAKIQAINDRLDKLTKPIRNFKDALGDLREKSGLDDVIHGFGGVGDAVGSLLSKLALVGGVAGLAIGGIMHLIGEFDDLGDKAERFGVTVDFLAQMRYAAEKAGAPVDALDGGLLSLSQNMGQLRAGTGRMLVFLEKVSPTLVTQLKATKSNEEAFYLLANAMAKIKDPAKAAALAQKTVGDAALAPLLMKGGKGVKELADKYADLAGSQQGAADKAGAVDDSLHDLKATTDGLKAALVEGLAPAIGDIVQKLAAWFKENRSRVAEFAAALGKRLPGAVAAVIDAIGRAVDAITPFVDSTTKLKIIAVALAAVLVGPLISAIASLGIALLTTPVGWAIAGLAGITAAAVFLSGKATGVVVPAIVAVGAAMLGLPGVGIVAGLVAAVGLLIAAWGPVKSFFAGLWNGITGIFEGAWEVIKEIVDKVRDAADWVADKASWIADHVGLGAVTDIVDKAREAEAKNQTQTAAQVQGKILVEIANAPKGTRAKVDPSSTANVDLSMGFQMPFGIGGA